MAEVTHEIEFTPDDTGALDEHLTRVVAALSGWIALLPEVDSDELPKPQGAFSKMFGGTRYDVPEVTFVAPERSGQGISVGIRHNHGQAIPWLASAEVTPPAPWRVMQDHPFRGLVLAAPPDTEPSELVGWTVDAATKLSRVPLLGGWLALIYEP